MTYRSSIVSGRVIWRSTKLGEIDRYCLAAICFDTPQDRRIFEAGKVAHYILEVAQTAINESGVPLGPTEVSSLCDKALSAVAEHGFVWEGAHEPPPRPSSLSKGRRLAEAWLLEKPLEPGFQVERKFTIDRWGMIVADDDPEAWSTGIIDRSGTEELADEESSHSVLAVDDYKSDWQSGSRKGEDGLELSLDNAQRKLYALGAWAMHRNDDFSALALRVHSLPRLWTYTRILEGEDMGILDAWRSELVAITDGYDRRIARHGLDPEHLASPGVGCFGCPHLATCKPGRRHLDGHCVLPAGDLPAATDETMARSYVAHSAEANRLAAYLRPLCDQTGVVRFDHTEVGYESKDETVVAKNAAEEVWREWKNQPREGVDTDGQQDAFEADLLQSYLDGVVLRSTTLTKLLTKLWPLNRGNKDEKEAKRTIRNRITDKVVSIRQKPVFGVRKISPTMPTLEEKLQASLDHTPKG